MSHRALLRASRFRLKSMLLFVALVGLWFGLYLGPYLQQRRAVNLLRIQGASIGYKWPQRHKMMKQVVRTWGPDAFLVANSVSFSDKDVNDNSLVALEGLHRIEHLALHNTSVTTSVLSMLGSRKCLSRFLLVRNSQIQPDTGSGLRLLAECPQLESLQLQNVSIPDDGLAFLNNCVKLRGLYLFDCTGLDDADLGVIAHLNPLYELALCGTTIADARLQQISRLPNLERLVLNRTSISDTGLKYVGQMPKLKELCLSETCISDPDLSHLTGLTSLEKLNLSSTSVTEQGAAWLMDELGRPVLLK